MAPEKHPPQHRVLTLVLFSTTVSYRVSENGRPGFVVPRPGWRLHHIAVAVGQAEGPVPLLGGPLDLRGVHLARTVRQQKVQLIVALSGAVGLDLAHEVAELIE